ncbi:hypothetical protein Cgig2_032728 [Carnegiea gigantea]|uniref:indole-3-pyruvate monooxygenase n=1 Tax=Carnegiea gigantea TaxID=171969 RepID=A0A9Q1KJC2_9CARY|nr:hypothetical protein Cgig2_032728 [Carnegiea gigantea]
MAEREDTLVFIVGAGPSGLAISACLARKSILFVIVEKEDCCGSLWKKRTYDRCHLHLAKEFCSLPFMPHSPETKKYMPKDDFIRYIDDYVSHFNIRPRYGHSVECAHFNEDEGKWYIEVKTNNMLPSSNNIVTKVFTSTFLVIATGENGKGFIPDIPGLKDFKGDVIHSNQYKSGLQYAGKQVLVVGCGNSGMEISYDLSNHEVNTFIVIRSPLHVVTRDMVWVGMHLLKYLSVSAVDFLIKLASYIKYGDLSKYGIHRPKNGPFSFKALRGRSPALPAISRINGTRVVFKDQVEYHFDAIIFATGYRSTACEWLKDYDFILDENGFPKNPFPRHWKGKNKLYCAGLSRMGLHGVSSDAIAIADDIHYLLQN